MIDFPTSPDNAPKLATTEQSFKSENELHFEEYYTEDPIEKIQTIYGISIMGLRKYFRNGVIYKIEPIFPEQ